MYILNFGISRCTKMQHTLNMIATGDKSNIMSLSECVYMPRYLPLSVITTDDIEIAEHLKSLNIHIVPTTIEIANIVETDITFALEQGVSEDIAITMMRQIRMTTNCYYILELCVKNKYYHGINELKKFNNVVVEYICNLRDDLQMYNHCQGFTTMSHDGVSPDITIQQFRQ